MNTIIFYVNLLSQIITHQLYPVSVISIYDGDTMTVNIQLPLDITLRNQTVRFCDIDTPEINRKETKEVALISKKRLVEIVNQSESLNLDIRGKDKYGRWLVYFIADSVNVNNLLLTENLAKSYNLKCN